MLSPVPERVMERRQIITDYNVSKFGFVKKKKKKVELYVCEKVVAICWRFDQEYKRIMLI